MKLTSYAQNFEDVMLWRALGNIERGRYIDIGAQDPLIDSVSLMFYEHGWRGIHVEPTPTYAELLRQARPDEIVIQAAVDDKNGTMSFYEFPSTGLSTGSREIADKHIRNGLEVREIVVVGVTLDDVFLREPAKEVHWLKIDVEGGERQVLSGWTNSSLRPWIVLIESTLPLSQVESHKQWEALIVNKGYKFAYFDGLNRFYIADAHPQLFDAFRSGPNVFDGFILSGTASSSLCADLNGRIHSLEDQCERDRHEADKHLAEQKHELSERSRALQGEAERVTQTAAVEQRELYRQLEGSHADLVNLSHTLVERERELSDRLYFVEQQALTLSKQLATREQELAGQLVTAHANAQALDAKERELTARLQASQADQARLCQALSQRELDFTERLRTEEKEIERLWELIGSRDREFNAQSSAWQNELASREHYFEAQLRASQADAARIAQSLSAVIEQLRNSEAETERVAQLLEVRDKEFADQLTTWRNEAWLATQNLALRERELGAQLLVSQAEVARISQALVLRESTATAEFYASELRAEAISQRLIAREQEMTRQLDRSLEDITQLEERERELNDRLRQKAWEATASEQRYRNEVQVIEGRLKAAEGREDGLNHEIGELKTHLARVEQARERLELQLNEQLRMEVAKSHRLQQELISLHGELVVVRGTLSWRLTTPLRAAAAWLATALLPAKYLSPKGSANSNPDASNADNSAGKSANSETMTKPRNLTEHAIMNDQITTSSTLEALLAHQDRAFIECAYLTLLRRPADASGQQFYLSRLRSGLPKIQILSEIVASSEARLVNVLLPGLPSAIRKYRLGRLPVIGLFVRLCFDAEGNGIREKRLRIVEQQVFGLASTTKGLLHSIEESISNLHESIGRQERQLTNVAEKIAEISTNQLRQSLTHPQGVSFQSNEPIRHLPAKRKRTLYYFVDHTVQCPTNTGVQRVTRRLAAAILASGERVFFVKWDSNRQELALVSRDELQHLSNWNGPTLPHAEVALYPVLGKEGEIAATHPFDEGSWLVVPEVTHITFHPEAVTIDVIAASRRKGLRTAFLYYDAIPLRRREHEPAALRHELYTQQMLLADLVVPISQWVSNDILSFFREHDHASLSPTPKVVPLLLPGESQIVPRVTRPALAHECERLILSVGTVEPRKNQITLLHAFEAFCKKNPNTDWQLLFAGNMHPDVAPEIARAVDRYPNIRYLQHVPDKELDALYRRCTFTVFPSLEEGFGLPILESLWYAKPCVCADFGAMGEVAAGGGCIMVDTHSEVEILRAIESLVESPDTCERLSREAVARHFSNWADYASCLTAEMDAAASPIANLGPVYYWVDHTCTFPANSGIQRVTRGLARALIELGVELIPVKWDMSARRIVGISSVERQHVSKWNGPPVSKWSEWRDPHRSHGWVLVPELTSYLPEPGIPGFREFLSQAGLRAAWIFYDTIPWKMREIYPVEATNAHRTYMSALNGQELVLAISKHSFNDLVGYLSQQPDRTPSLFERVYPCPLAGEFVESPRVMLPKESSDRSVMILCVGTVEPRKNHLLLLDAFKELTLMTDIRVELVIAGGAPFEELAKRVESFIGSEPQIRWVKSPSDSDLGKLYEECDFTVYASLEEGFGLPILESLWHARPCVCASFGAMEEVAQGGGCLLTEVHDRSELANSMLKLVNDEGLRRRLSVQATRRQFKTWQDYALEVATYMASERVMPLRPSVRVAPNRTAFYREFVNLKPRPLLSICITTYNRAAWLKLNLRNLARLWPEPQVNVEFLVCDNTSTDNTREVVSPYIDRSDFRYVRNPQNVGMLGNLRVTANQARGEYIWILGDDDLVCPGAIERVLDAIRANAGTALVYLNYSYTRLDDASAISNLDEFLKESTPIVAPGPDRTGSIREICTESENFFTAIYCLVFRRDHAIRAYTQNTDGRPFSTLLTCIPTTFYVLTHMINEPACWVGTPVLVVNLNVSWMKYAPLWILERIPEVYDLAERLGADRVGIDRWRKNNLPGIVHFLKEIFERDPEGNLEFFLMRRLVSRLKGIEGIDESIDSIRSIYRSAHEAGHPAAQTMVEEMFAGFVFEKERS